MNNMDYGYHRITAGGLLLSSMQPEHLEATATLLGGVSAREIEQRREQFPGGQLIAYDYAEDTLAAVASGLLVAALPDRPRANLIGDAAFSAHDPQGQWLYGVELVIQPAYTQEGIGIQFMQMRFEVVRQLTLDGFFTVEPVPAADADAILNRQQTHARVEALHRTGLQLVGQIPNFLPDGSTGIVLTYRNPEKRMD